MLFLVLLFSLSIVSIKTLCNSCKTTKPFEDVLFFNPDIITYYTWIWLSVKQFTFSRDFAVLFVTKMLSTSIKLMRSENQEYCPCFASNVSKWFCYVYVFFLLISFTKLLNCCSHLYNSAKQQRNMGWSLWTAHLKLSNKPNPKQVPNSF